MPDVPRGSSLLSRGGTGSTPGILPGSPLGGIPTGRAGTAGYSPSPQQRRYGAQPGPELGSAYITPQFEPTVREQFALFDQLGTSGLQDLQARHFSAVRNEFAEQLSRYLETQGMGGAKIKPRGNPFAKGVAPQAIVDPEAVERATILGEAARAAITGLRTEPVKFRAKGGLITRRQPVL